MGRRSKIPHTRDELEALTDEELNLEISRLKDIKHYASSSVIKSAKKQLEVAQEIRDARKQE